MRVNASTPSPLGEQFWGSADVRQRHEPPLWIRAIYSKQEVIMSGRWNLQLRIRPRGYHQTGYDFATNHW